jgi:hypothetical protein
MKNFSTVSARLALGVICAGLLAAPAQAASCAFRPNAPDQHLVVTGDTLWDISGKFLEHPWCWPQVWGMNKEEIRNPHWIYPNQIIYFDRANRRLSLSRPGADESANGANGADGGPTGTLKLSHRRHSRAPDRSIPEPASGGRGRRAHGRAAYRWRGRRAYVPRQGR